MEGVEGYASLCIERNSIIVSATPDITPYTLHLHTSHSVSSVHSGSEKLHRRGSSLVNQQEAAEMLADMKKHQTRNHSSPDMAADASSAAAAAMVTTKENDSVGGIGSVDSTGVEGSKGHSTKVKASLSESLDSRVSIRSDITLSEDNRTRESLSRAEDEEEDDDVITPSQNASHSFPSVSSPREVVDHMEVREERAGTVNSDMSGSCSTLQNERLEGGGGGGEMESSLEHIRKLQMSLAFRQELLNNVTQLKTDSRVGVEVAKLTESNFDLVQLLGRSLPHIVPNVNLAKREVKWV